MGLRRTTRAVAASWRRKAVYRCTPTGIDRWPPKTRLPRPSRGSVTTLPLALPAYATGICFLPQVR